MEEWTKEERKDEIKEERSESKQSSRYIQNPGEIDLDEPQELGIMKNWKESYGHQQVYQQVRI